MSHLHALHRVYKMRAKTALQLRFHAFHIIQNFSRVTPVDAIDESINLEHGDIEVLAYLSAGKPHFGFLRWI